MFTSEDRLKSAPDQDDDTPHCIQSSGTSAATTARECDDSVVENSVLDERRSSATATPSGATQWRPAGVHEFADLDELQFLKLQGVDRNGRRLVRIVGKFFPAQVIDAGRLDRYLARKFTTDIDDEQFSLLYFHTRVSRRENSPGVLTLRRVYENLPKAVRQNLRAIYIVHPGLWSRVLLATVGRLVLTNGFYSKVIYISRLEFLWDHIDKKDQVQIPEFVKEHDKELEDRPLMDYGLETDPYGDIVSGSDRGRSRPPDRYFGY